MVGIWCPMGLWLCPIYRLPCRCFVAHPNGAVTPPHTPAVLAATADHLAAKFGKRSAEAEPWLGYGYGLGGWGLGGWGPAGIAGPKSAPCVNAWNVPVSC